MGKQGKVVKLDIYVGYDGKVEPVAYHNFCQSVIEKSSIPVSFTPLALNTLQDYEETHTDGSNAFIYSRFLVPSTNNAMPLKPFRYGTRKRE